MSNRFARELARSLNSEARHRYPEVAKKLGMSSITSSLIPSFELRVIAPYPYKLIEDDSLLPLGKKTFGRVIKRNREEGIAEIHASIGKTTEEHGWLFLPSDSIWVDTTVAADEANVERDQFAHIFLSHLYPAVEAVHTHPDTTVRNLAVEQPWSYSHNYLLEAAQPSGSDLISHCQMVARTAPNSRQVSTIVSHFGTTSFVMNGDTGKFGGFRTEAYDRLIQDASEPMKAIRQTLGRLSAHVLRNDDTPAISIDFIPLTSL